MEACINDSSRLNSPSAGKRWQLQGKTFSFQPTIIDTCSCFHHNVLQTRIYLLLTYARLIKRPMLLAAGSNH